MKLLLILLAGILLIGCGGGGVRSGTPERDLNTFESALDLAGYDNDIGAAKQSVLSLTYNEPQNAFWTLSLWGGTSSYVFKNWNISQSGDTAMVVLTYASVDSVSGNERNTSQKTFTMKRFGNVWRVNLAEFVGLN